MKKNAIQAFVLVLFTVLVFASCDMINDFIANRTRNIAVIQIYNSNHVKTNRLVPNDTLYVEVQGLKAGGFYKVECLDPNGDLITMLTAVADENGVITPSPLWYDVGFKKLQVGGVWKAVLPSDTELGLRAFNIHVQSLDTDVGPLTMTDFKLPFFVVFNTDIANRPQPIITACRKDATSGELYLENAFLTGEDLWIKATNLNELPFPAPTSGKVRIYIVPFDSAPYEEGTIISNVVLEQEATVAELAAGVKITATSKTWAGGESWSPIPDGAKNHAFSVIVDVNENGIYEVGTDQYHLDGIDGNGVAGFIVKPAPVPAPSYIKANIASGGITWGHYWFDAWPDYDYRNEYHADGTGTQYGWDWAFSGYGVKAIWNPYINTNLPQTPNSASVLYYGRYVDLYIVKQDDGTHATDMIDLTGVNPLVPASGTRKLTMPVQYACTNGANQQTIWRAPMVVGNYCVVVDLDGNGKVSAGDIVDNIGKDGNIRAAGGFSVIP